MVLIYGRKLVTSPFISYDCVISIAIYVCAAEGKSF
jgi:hypothetical protein